MAKINLLPWRAERRKQRQKEFYLMLGGAALAAILITFGIVKYFDHLIGVQSARNNLLTNEIAELDVALNEIKDLEKRKAALEARKAVIDQLQSNRLQMVHLFDALVRTLPDGVRLNSIKQSGEGLTLEGVAQSNARVASYMREIDSSTWLTEAEVSIIDEAKGGDRSMPRMFTLKVKLIRPKSEEEGAQAGNNAVAPAGGAL